MSENTPEQQPVQEEQAVQAEQTPQESTAPVAGSDAEFAESEGTNAAE